MKVLFFLSLSLILYTYIIYPVFLFIFASIVQLVRDVKYICHRMDRRRRHCKDLPLVSIIVAAFNEEKVIEEKILNCLLLSYPKDKIEFIIASDGSTDGTNSIVESYGNRGVKLLAFPERSGKSSVLNRTIPHARGEIVILSDANTIYEHDAILNLVRHFSDPKIGGVCGELRLKSSKSETKHESSYWQFENILKFLENRIGSTLGANGGIYAIRKDMFQPIPPDTVIDDFVIFMKIREKGFKTIFDPEAIAFEETAPDLKGEYKRRTRIGAGNFQSIRYTRNLLNPLKGVVAFSFWSHKVLRWCVPFLIIVIFITNVFLINVGIFYKFFLSLQTFGYFMAILGFVFKEKRWFILRISYYFLLMNLALISGFVKYVTGNQKSTWERTQR